MLKTGALKIEEIPTINVVKVNGEYITLDNRRLYVLQESFKGKYYSLHNTIRVNVVSLNELVRPGVTAEQDLYDKSTSNEPNGIKIRDGKPKYFPRVGKRGGLYIYNKQDVKIYLSRLSKKQLNNILNNENIPNESKKLISDILNKHHSKNGEQMNEDTPPTTIDYSIKAFPKNTTPVIKQQSQNSNNYNPVNNQHQQTRYNNNNNINNNNNYNSELDLIGLLNQLTISSYIRRQEINNYFSTSSYYSPTPSYSSTYYYPPSTSYYSPTPSYFSSTTTSSNTNEFDPNIHPRAPKGGVEYKGVFYKGGQFVPKDR
ncbi:leucine-rich repeat-containing protein (LRR) [Tieghemostelium lacteum]|uniref:Leucine-rich repeat-containing protein (LRR) n=1 Tax=Tieghemostelium lacteum TaxID=361077 RepID=A0A152A4M6_TIELA|nr:leucine-rich repeat-containing protein (LRR) [Tieghemostelium lacteum]|eukprot:KYR01190.1 leucine-rich repeat-containing protein (LRR) [Tieghemostelium lacteum]